MIENNKCLTCGAEIQPNRKYCSKSCKDKYYYSSKRSEKVCVRCRKPFKGTANQVCCSRECSIKMHKNKWKRCNICNKRFKGTGKQLYCGEVCYRVANADRVGYGIKTCLVCDRAFRSRISQIEHCCSSQCSSKLIDTLVERSHQKLLSNLK